MTQMVTLLCLSCCDSCGVIDLVLVTLARLQIVSPPIKQTGLMCSYVDFRLQASCKCHCALMSYQW